MLTENSSVNFTKTTSTKVPRATLPSRPATTARDDSQNSLSCLTATLRPARTCRYHRPRHHHGRQGRCGCLLTDDNTTTVQNTRPGTRHCHPGQKYFCHCGTLPLMTPRRECGRERPALEAHRRWGRKGVSLAPQQHCGLTAPEAYRTRAIKRAADALVVPDLTIRQHYRNFVKTDTKGRSHL